MHGFKGASVLNTMNTSDRSGLYFKRFIYCKHVHQQRLLFIDSTTRVALKFLYVRKSAPSISTF